MRHRTLVTVAALVAPPLTASAGPCLDTNIILYSSDWRMFGDTTSALMETEMFQEVSVTQLDTNTERERFFEGDTAIVFMSGPAIPIDPNETWLALQRRHGDAYQTFVEAGGGLVFTHGGIGQDYGPLGDFRQQYIPLSSPGGSCSRGESSPAASLPAESRLFWQVSSLFTNERTRRACPDWSVTDAATVHAWWDDGQPLVASKNGVYAVNVYGHSDAIPLRPGTTSSYGYPAASDFPQLFANALYLSAGFDPETACNGDYDDDGLLDEEEATLGTDFQRADTDADGVNDGIDNCPTDANPDQHDADQDGIGDGCDPEPGSDQDGDGVPDANDNCPAVVNPDQIDTNEDGIGDACESESITCSTVPRGSGLLAPLGLALIGLRRRRWG